MAGARKRLPASVILVGLVDNCLILASPKFGQIDRTVFGAALIFDTRRTRLSLKVGFRSRRFTLNIFQFVASSPCVTSAALEL